MKKILFIILLFLSLIKIVNAEVIYSEYNSPIEYEEEVLESDLIKVEKEERYLYYNEIKTLGDYYIEGENPTSFPLIDKTDFRESEFSNWTRFLVNDKKNRVIESRKVSFYKIPEKIRYIHFYNLQGNYYNFRIPELQIIYDGKKLEYEYYCEGCSEYFDTFIRNGKVEENMSHVENGGYLRIDLKKYYDPTKLQIDLFLYDVEDTTKTYTIDLTKTEEYGENSFYRRTFNEDFKHNFIGEFEHFSYTLSDLYRVNPTYFDYYVYDDEKSLYSSEYMIEEYTEKRYKDVYFRYYNLEKKYSDEYLTEKTDKYPYKDNNMSKTYYLVSKREKVVFLSFDAIQQSLIAHAIKGAARMSFNATKNKNENQYDRNRG